MNDPHQLPWPTCRHSVHREQHLAAACGRHGPARGAAVALHDGPHVLVSYSFPCCSCSSPCCCLDVAPPAVMQHCWLFKRQPFFPHTVMGS